MPGWSDADLAHSAFVGVLAFWGPGLVFIALAVVLERRAGARWLPPLWAVAVAGLLAIAARAPSRRFQPSEGGPAEVGGALTVVALVFGVAFALAAVAVWLQGRGRRSAWVQATVAFGALSVGYVLGALLTVAATTFRGG